MLFHCLCVLIGPPTHIALSKDIRVDVDSNDKFMSAIYCLEGERGMWVMSVYMYVVPRAHPSLFLLGYMLSILKPHTPIYIYVSLCICIAMYLYIDLL